MFSTWIKRNGGVRVEHCKGNTLQVKKNIAKKTPNVNHSHAKYRETDALWLFISKEDSECWRFSSNHQTGCLQKKNPNWLSLTRLATMQPLAPYGIHTDNCSWYFLYLPAPTEFGLRSCLVKEERWAPLPSNSQVQCNFHGLADVPHKKMPYRRTNPMHNQKSHNQSTTPFTVRRWAILFLARSPFRRNFEPTYLDKIFILGVLGAMRYHQASKHGTTREAIQTTASPSCGAQCTDAVPFSSFASTPA